MPYKLNTSVIFHKVGAVGFPQCKQISRSTTKFSVSNYSFYAPYGVLQCNFKLYFSGLFKFYFDNRSKVSLISDRALKTVQINNTKGKIYFLSYCFFASKHEVSLQICNILLLDSYFINKPCNMAGDVITRYDLDVSGLGPRWREEVVSF